MSLLAAEASPVSMPAKHAISSKQRCVSPLEQPSPRDLSSPNACGALIRERHSILAKSLCRCARDGDRRKCERRVSRIHKRCAHSSWPSRGECLQLHQHDTHSMGAPFTTWSNRISRPMPRSASCATAQCEHRQQKTRDTSTNNELSCDVVYGLTKTGPIMCVHRA